MALGLLGAAVCALWLHQVDRAGWPQALAVGVWLLATAAAAYNWQHPPSGVLRWDGQGWHFESARAALPGRSLLRLDLQGCLLVEFLPEAGRTQWFWLERGAEPLRWDALRRALCAPAAARLAGAAPADAGGAGS